MNRKMELDYCLDTGDKRYTVYPIMYLAPKISGKSPKGMVNVPTIIVKVKHSTIGEKVVAAALIPTHGMAAPNSNNASADGNIMEEEKL
ncbi:uncharacterized protein LOC113301221 isoform X3 [Papaver somniferum]|uniref:uncharacterized protein LOC113301221 isoform X3 n=1 Tax=Papaver somniferum TaxID=3469 RepID=UPI000E705411|nr:uncharacterized protein LOC113301221 isoform X3 [Papaver somniferum]